MEEMFLIWNEYTESDGPEAVTSSRERAREYVLGKVGPIHGTPFTADGIYFVAYPYYLTTVRVA